MTRIRANYHTHTFRCKHASGEVIDYARAALEGGAEVLGMTDHTPLPGKRWASVRMESGELPGYLAAIDEARAACPELTILAGLECEPAEELSDYYREELLERLGITCLVAGCHWFLHRGEWLPIIAIDSSEVLFSYARHLVRAIESGLYEFIAHPDVFAVAWLPWDDHAIQASRMILEAAATYAVPLEINGYGMRKGTVDAPEGTRLGYPLEVFWELASEHEGLEVVCNSDAHEPWNVLANITDGLAMAERFGLPVADLSHLEKREAEHAGRR